MSFTIGPPSVKPICCWVKSNLSASLPSAFLGAEDKRVVLEVDVQRAVHLVGARLGDDVDEAAVGAAELGVGALGHDHHLLDRVEVEGEGRALAAALLAEERVVEVGAVDRDVVVDALLAVDRELVAVRALHDGDAGRELGEVEEVAAVVRQALDRRLVDARRRPRRGWSRSPASRP